jgi:hypothetical protein
MPWVFLWLTLNFFFEGFEGGLQHTADKDLLVAVS